MLPNLTEFHRPLTLTAALRLLARESVRTVPLAGGTALIPSRDPWVQAVVDLGALHLAGVDWCQRHTHIGAMTTLQALASDENAQRYADGLLAEAARVCVTRNIRNVATVGGTLVAGGAACDLLVALLALDAQVTINTQRMRTLPLDEWLNASPNRLERAIITHLTFPAPKLPYGAALVRLARTPSDTAIVNAAVFVVPDGDICKRVRLALGGVAPQALRMAAIESELEGRAWDPARVAGVAADAAAALTPPTDGRASGEYRRQMAAVIAQRALAHAWTRAQGEEP